MRHRLAIGAWALAGLALAAPAFGHGDEARDQAPPARADFVPPAPGTYTLQAIMRAPAGTVVDLDGRDRRLAEVTTGKITLLSFVYTRCSDAWGCPLAYRVFDAVATAMERIPGLRSRVRLVTLSFDPRHDTPAVMRQSAGEQAARGIDWRFLTTRSDAQLAPILEALGQDVSRVPGSVEAFEHTVKVFLVDERSRVREIYSSAYLMPEMIVNDIRTLDREARGSRPHS